MFTDMVGYTALGQTNEPLSLALAEEQKKLIRPILKRHTGREVKTMGDAFLIEFANALDAVRCAYDIQRASREFNLAQRNDRRINLRVGLHVGDVEESNGDIFGDAVNVASRIEPLAEDGGVCLTRQVHDQVQNKFDLPLVSIGKKTLKNVAIPVETFKVVFPWDERRPRKTPIRTLDRKRIAILPLVSLSPDPNDEYFADGTTEELISTLSNISNLTIISRTSVMQYKGAKKSLAEIGRELRAGTILEGSIRKAGNRIRITVQLLDAAEDKHLWSESYDRQLQDVFAVQSDIAKNVADTLRVKLLANEQSQIRKKPTENTVAYLFYLKGRQSWNKRSEEDVRNGIEFFRQASEEDPSFAPAYVGLADSYLVMRDEGWSTQAEIYAGRRAISKALRLDATLAEAHASLGLAMFHDWNWDASEIELKKAIELNANYATAHQWYSILLGGERRLEEAVSEAKKALELDPLSPIISFNVGLRLIACKRPDEAMEFFRRSLASDPSLGRSLGGMILACLQKEEFDEAMEWWEKYARVMKRSSWELVSLATIRAHAGDKDGAIMSLDDAMSMPDFGTVHRLQVAHVYAVLRDEKKMLEWLQKALTAHDTWISSINESPIFDEFRSSPAFLELLRELGLDKY